MIPINLTVDTFIEHVKKEGIVVIDFWASWCGPCRAFAPIFEAAARANPEITWAKVDTDAEPALSSALGIRSIPTLMVFRDGVLVFSQAGLMPAPVLDNVVQKTRGLDMEDVRRRLAEHTSESSSPGPRT